MSVRTRELAPRTATADRVARSVCPYCAVGCGQLVYVKGERIVDIEGDPDSPISQGCLCPKGAATFQLVTGSQHEHHGTALGIVQVENQARSVRPRRRHDVPRTWRSATRSASAG